MDTAEFIEMFADPDSLVGMFAAVAAFAAIVTIAAPLMKKDKFGERLKSVTTHRDALRAKHHAALGINSGRKSLRQDTKGMMRSIVDRLQLAKLLEDPGLAMKMMQAGIRGQRPIIIFYFARLATPVFLFVGLLIYLFTIKDYDLAPMMRFAVAFGSGVFGYYLPGIYLTNVATKRRGAIMSAFPDALDLLLICVESGMSIEAAFQKVAAEIGSASLELSEELSLTTAELSYLQERRQAYVNLAMRTNHPGVKAVSTALVQAERYGTPLGNALRVMAKENRDMRMAAAEKKAASLPAQLTVPMILFFLPVLFVVILGPAIIRFQHL